MIVVIFYHNVAIQRYLSGAGPELRLCKDNSLLLSLLGERGEPGVPGPQGPPGPPGKPLGGAVFTRWGRKHSPSKTIEMYSGKKQFHVSFN